MDKANTRGEYLGLEISFDPQAGQYMTVFSDII
jgi:hypothetical protein